MARTFLFLLLSCWAVIPTVSAQELRDIMLLHLSDGTTVKYDVSGIDYVEFVQEGDPADPSGHQPVDLGLSVRWAATNIGADTPEDYGTLYSWGETTAKSNYAEEKYRYYGVNGYTDIGRNISGTQYDVASVRWKYGWRMPTFDEVNELTTKCTWTAETLNGVKGYRITGPNANSIFLPLAGYQSGTERKKAGTCGYYWTGTLNQEVPTAAYTLNTLGYDEPWSASRAYGFSIRAVKE